MGAMYMLAISLAFEAAFESQSGMSQEKVVYLRERAARTYGPGVCVGGVCACVCVCVETHALLWTSTAVDDEYYATNEGL